MARLMCFSERFIKALSSAVSLPAVPESRLRSKVTERLLCSETISQLTQILSQHVLLVSLLTSYSSVVQTPEIKFKSIVALVISLASGYMSVCIFRWGLFGCCWLFLVFLWFDITADKKRRKDWPHQGNRGVGLWKEAIVFQTCVDKMVSGITLDWYLFVIFQYKIKNVMLYLSKVLPSISPLLNNVEESLGDGWSRILWAKSVTSSSVFRL